MKLTRRELATVLAALRYWQREGIWGDPRKELDIATDGGEIEPLGQLEIDGLCERLNYREDSEAVNAEVLDSLKECSSLLEVFSPRHELNTAVMRAKRAIAKSEKAEQKSIATPEEITQARELYGREGEIEIDDNARASRGDDDGAYIEAWVWVPKKD